MKQLKFFSKIVLAGLLVFLLVNCQKDEAQNEAQLLTAKSQNESLQLKAAVVVPPYMQNLITTINDMVGNGILTKDEGQSLLAKINSAANSINKGNIKALNGQLGALINELNYLVEMGTISQELGLPLLNETQLAIDLVNDRIGNSFKVNNTSYVLNQGTHVWFGEMDCGNYDVYAHGIYLTSDVSISSYNVGGGGKALVPSGAGNMIIFNLFNKSMSLTPGTYVFVDQVNCDGTVTDGVNTFTMNPTDKFVTAVKEMNDPTCYGLNVDLEIDWANVDFNSPSQDVMNKYMNYVNSRIGIKEGSVTVVQDGSDYVISFDCIDNNGAKIIGSYKGTLNFVEFTL